MESPSENEPLLDLRVSLFGDIYSDAENHVQAEEFQDAIQSIEKSLDQFCEFRKESAQFLRDHSNTMETLQLYNEKEYIPKLLRTNSFPSLQSPEEPESTSSGSSLSSSASSLVQSGMPTTRELYQRNTQSMYGTDIKENTGDPFDLRQREINALVSSLRKDLDKFKCSLEKTEDLVRDVQVDMDDTRNRMETYIKDIPESHYSAVSVHPLWNALFDSNISVYSLKN